MNADKQAKLELRALAHLIQHEDAWKHAGLLHKRFFISTEEVGGKKLAVLKGIYQTALDHRATTKGLLTHEAFYDQLKRSTKATKMVKARVLAMYEEAAAMDVEVGDAKSDFDKLRGPHVAREVKAMIEIIPAEVVPNLDKDPEGALALLYAKVTHAYRTIAGTGDRERILNDKTRDHDMGMEALRAVAAREKMYVYCDNLCQLDASGASPRLQQVTEVGMRGAISRSAVFVNRYFKDEAEEFEEIAVPPNAAKAAHNLAPTSGYFDRIAGLTHTPCLLTTGAWCMTRGEVVDGRLYAGEEVSGPGTVTEADVKAALKWIGHSLTDFPFDGGRGGASRANCLAAILTPFVRPWFGASPFCRIEASQAATGKSLLARTITAYHSPCPPAPVAYSADEEAFAKALQAVISGAPMAVLLDNVRGAVTSQLLESLVSERTVQFRVLGDNTRTRTVSFGGEIYLTANDARMTYDLASRGYTVRLDAAMPNPEKRTGFTHADPVKHVEEHRHEAVAACMTLVQWWHQLGSPKDSESAEKSRFKSWGETLGGILKVAGVPGFLANQEETVRTADPETEAWATFVSNWYDQYGGDELRPTLIGDMAFGREQPMGDEDPDGPLLSIYPFNRTTSRRGLLTALGTALARSRKVFDVKDGATVRIAGGNYNGRKTYRLVAGTTGEPMPTKMPECLRGIVADDDCDV